MIQIEVHYLRELLCFVIVKPKSYTHLYTEQLFGIRLEDNEVKALKQLSILM